MEASVVWSARSASGLDFPLAERADHNGSLEVSVGLAVLGILFPQPGVELAVMLRALLAAVGTRIVTQIQLPPPPARHVWVRAVRGEPAEDRHVARVEK